MNKAIIIGRVGRDPELRALPSGQPVASFSVATSRRWKDKAGQKQEETEWHNVVAFGRTAEVAGQYVSKGDQIAIEGRIKTRSWDDRTSGEKKYRTEIVVDHLELLGGNKRKEGGEAPRGRTTGGDYGGYSDGGGEPEDDDNIPF